MANRKTTVPVSSVGADGEQSNSKNTNEIITNSQTQINVQAAKMCKPQKARRNPGRAGLILYL